MYKRKKNAIIKVPIANTITAVGLVPDVYVTVRAALYTRMYEIAKEHKDLAKRYAGKERKAETKESMISILFAYTCLEAYINAIGIDHLGKEWGNYSGKDTSPTSKWLGVSKWLASKKYEKRHSVFNQNKEPFKSFLKLKTIREEHLVHWKAQAHEPVLTNGILEDTPIAEFYCGKAEWACDTVKQMVTKLNENMNAPPDANWLD